MKTKMKMALLLAIAVSCFILASCNKNENVAKLGDLQINFGDYKDSEVIPSWTGNKLKIKVWQDTNSPNAYLRYAQSPDDAFAPEFGRITGVSFDPDESFDNAGNSFDAKITQIVASGDFPDMAESLPEMTDLIKTKRLWELSGYIEKYCPNIMKMMGPDTAFRTVWENQKEEYGGLYALEIGNNKGSVKKMVEEDGSYNLTKEQIDSICGPGTSPYGYVYIRDDVLKRLYPESHTAEELKAIYKNNGTFAREEIFDVPLEKPQDFIDMLYRIKSMNIQDGQGTVYPMYTHEGSDNWTALTTGGGAIFGYNAHYFDYVDLKTGKAEYTFKQDWFKNVLKTYNKLIRDGIVPTENLMDTAQTHKEKISNARYIVSLFPNEPNTTGLNGKYKYRKVFLKYDKQFDKFMTSGTKMEGLRGLSFFKDSLSENELIQALRSVDFLVSLPGQKLTYWGSKSAGLYNESKDGVLQYNDEKLKNQMLDNNAYGSDLIEKYGLGIGAWPGHPFVVASGVLPEAFYTKSKGWESLFDPAKLNGEAINLPQTATLEIFSPTYVSSVPGAKSFWMARKAFEDAMLQIFAASDDAEFIRRYNDMVALAERNGLTDEALAQFQSAFDKSNKPFKEEQEKFKAEMKIRYSR